MKYNFLFLVIEDIIEENEENVYDNNALQTLKGYVKVIRILTEFDKIDKMK